MHLSGRTSHPVLKWQLSLFSLKTSSLDSTLLEQIQWVSNLLSLGKMFKRGVPYLKGNVGKCNCGNEVERKWDWETAATREPNNIKTIWKVLEVSSFSVIYLMTPSVHLSKWISKVENVQHSFIPDKLAKPCQKRADKDKSVINQPTKL